MQTIQQDDALLGGAMVFADTRVPITTLWDYLENGESLDGILAA